MSTPQNQIDGEIKMMRDMLGDLCMAISQILKIRYPTMPADHRFNRAYCMAVELLRNHVQAEFGPQPPAATHRQN